MLDEILEETKDDMEKSIEALKSDLASMRTGRASTGLVDKLLIEYYGTPTPLQELAMVTVPEAQLIAIRPYDPGALQNIERAIMQSNINLTPNNDGKIIRLQIPSLTEERRRELTKAASKRVEDAKVSIRNTRRSGNDTLRDFEKEKEITEDDLHLGLDKVQKLTDDYIKQAGDIGTTKEKEILEV
ncbi:MAG: ribosome recycling factor [Chloroflexota bacterium]